MIGILSSLSSKPKRDFLREQEGRGCRRRKRGEYPLLLGAWLGSCQWIWRIPLGRAGGGRLHEST